MVEQTLGKDTDLRNQKEGESTERRQESTAGLIEDGMAEELEVL